jgi:hypothetical protein
MFHLIAQAGRFAPRFFDKSAEEGKTADFRAVGRKPDFAPKI